MNPRSASSGSGRSKLVLVAAALVPLLFIAVVVIVIMVMNHRTTAPIAHPLAATKCLDKEFGTGSSGDCVADIHAMVNFMETDGLTQCPFIGGGMLPMSDYYDSQTAQQVTVVQNWLTCFDKEEGIAPPKFTAGTVGLPTWSELCTYAYAYPAQNNDTKSSYRTQSLAAGKDAGCASVTTH